MNWLPRPIIGYYWATERGDAEFAFDIIFLPLVFCWYAAAQRVALWTMFACSVGAVGFCYLIAWLVPQWVMLTDKGIHLIRGDSAVVLRYEKIQRAQLVQMDVERQAFTILDVVNDKGRRLKIGLSRKISPDDLQKFLESRGVAVERNDVQQAPAV